MNLVRGLLHTVDKQIVYIYIYTDEENRHRYWVVLRSIFSAMKRDFDKKQVCQRQLYTLVLD